MTAGVGGGGRRGEYQSDLVDPVTENETKTNQLSVWTHLGQVTPDWELFLIDGRVSTHPIIHITHTKKKKKQLLASWSVRRKFFLI